MSLTLADIDNAENAVKNVRVKLQEIGREIYKMREGSDLGLSYGFDGYHRWQYSGQNYLHQEGPDWGVGTPIFSIKFYWPRSEDSVSVTLPQAWLEQDWRSLEQARLDKKRADEDEQERIEELRQAGEIEAAELATYERLKAKFESSPSVTTGAYPSSPENEQGDDA